MSPYGKKRAPEPIEDARDVIARDIEGKFPGITVTHDLYGWTAVRDGKELCRVQSSPALEALLPYYFRD